MTQAQQADFDRFWRSYPRRVGKLAAQRQWERSHPDLDAVLTALAWQTQQEQWQERDAHGVLRWVPHPATWIHAGRWLDEPPTGGGTVSAAEFSRAEKLRQACWGRCPHDPHCEDYAACITAIARDTRTPQGAA